MSIFTTFVWDEPKRLLNIEKHGFDFRGILEVLSGIYYTFPSNFKEEERQIIIGYLRNVEVAVIYTQRREEFRVISIRCARRSERSVLHSLANEGT